MIRSISLWFDRNPLIAVWLGFVACFVLLLAARAWDQADTTAIRTQMMANRSST